MWDLELGPGFWRRWPGHRQMASTTENTAQGVEPGQGHRTELKLEMLPQPDDTTCGPTCLHAIYRYWNRDISLDQVISEVKPLPNGGTLAVMLA